MGCVCIKVQYTFSEKSLQTYRTEIMDTTNICCLYQNCYLLTGNLLMISEIFTQDGGEKKLPCYVLHNLQLVL